ncbi:MAG TPA: hypothetical protein VJR89_11735, partial [Polyangiales bacterium]|nr:hypothetical protein [Polyangiales bacterium]
MMRVWAALLALICGCGAQPVEFNAKRGEIEDAPDEMVGEVPAEAIARLQAASEGADKGVDLLYPAPSQLAIPANLAPIAFEWRAAGDAKGMMMPMAPMAPAMPMMPIPPMMGPGKMMMPPKGMEEAGAKAFELSLTAGETSARLYTLATSASFPVERWRSVLRGAVGQRLRVRVRAVPIAGGAITGSKPLDIEVRGPLPEGAIVSWSATGGGLAAAAISSSHETRLAVPGASGCVGCHAVSRDGKRVLAADGGRTRLLSWSTTGADPVEIPLL